MMHPTHSYSTVRLCECLSKGMALCFAGPHCGGSGLVATDAPWSPSCRRLSTTGQCRLDGAQLFAAPDRNWDVRSKTKGI